MRTKKTIVSLINIGSNLLTMRIMQLSNDRIETLEVLERPLRIGREVFSTSKISFASIREISASLKKYSQVMKEYGVLQCQAFATTALRESANRSFVLDQLRILNHIDIQILPVVEECTLIYWEMLRRMPTYKELMPGGSLLCYIGTGSMGVAYYDGEHMLSSCQVPLGTLKVMDMLKSIQDHSPDFYVALEEYLDSFITRLQSQLCCGKVANLIVSGNAIDHLANACGAQQQDGYAVLKKEALVTFHRHTRTQSLMQIAARHHMSEDAAEIFYSLFNIFAKMTSFLDSDNIIAPNISLFDPLAQQTLFAARRTDYQNSARAYALASARTIAKRYGSNLAHIENVYENAILLFDKTKRYHGLKNYHRFLLELAVLLHDCGHFTSTHHHANSTYSIIINSFISGVSEEDLMIVGNIARHNEFLQSAAGSLKKTEIQTYKLSALLWLANSLDKSHRQKIRSPRVRVSGNTLKIVAISDKNLLLEQWAFEECIPFFEEVSGLKPEFVQQTLLL